MTVGICGLGLIGGSMAMAYKQAGHTVLGYDRSEETLKYAAENEMIDGLLLDDTIPRCHLIFIGLYPQAAAEYLEHIAPIIANSDTVVMDLCGTKKHICEVGFALAKEYSFTFIGAHPMAGRQFSGIRYAKETLFKGASMVLVPPDGKTDMIAGIEQMLYPASFGQIKVTTAEEHDAMIAFTSQLAHLVSNAYIKSPTAQNHKGFSAGSYKDLTRVAYLNEYMWTELFLENRGPLLAEVNTIINSLCEYRDAIADNDGEKLCKLLRDGRIAKEQIDG